MFKILYVGKYLIISSVVKTNDNDMNSQAKIFFNDGIFCELFEMEELRKMNEEDFVPKIKELSIQALENYDKFI